MKNNALSRSSVRSSVPRSAGTCVQQVLPYLAHVTIESALDVHYSRRSTPYIQHLRAPSLQQGCLIRQEDPCRPVTKVATRFSSRANVLLHPTIHPSSPSSQSLASQTRQGICKPRRCFDLPAIDLKLQLIGPYLLESKCARTTIFPTHPA